MALAENSGLSPITSLSEVKAKQVKENNPHYGVDCNQMGTSGTSVPHPLPHIARSPCLAMVLTMPNRCCFCDRSHQT